MYRFVSYTLLFLLTMLVLSGCHTESKTYRQMAWVDTLVYQNLADSAYVELLKVKNRVKTERERAYYGLLLTKIKYMQHQSLDTDSLVSQSIAYYRKSGEDEKLADAYLAKGKNLYYRGNVKQSVTCLKESEKFVANDDNLSLKSELYRFLSMVNSRNDEFALAVKYAQKALDIAETHNNKVWKVSAYSRMAILYAKLEQEDSACFYINKCIPLLNVMSPQGAVIVMDNIGYLNQDRNPQLALRYLNKALHSYPTVDTYDNLARIYAKQGRKAKADSLWRRALQTDDVAKRCMIVGAMLKYETDYGDLKETVRLSRWLVALKDSVARQRQEAHVKELQTEFDVQMRDAAQQRHINNLCWTIAFCLLVIAAVVVIAGCAVRNRRLKLYAERKERDRQIQEYQAMIARLETACHTSQTTIADMEKHDKDYQRTIGRLKAKLEQLQRLNVEEECKARLLYESAMRGESISDWRKADQQSFLDYCAKAESDFLLSLNATYDALTPREKIFLVLLHQGMAEEQVQRMLNLSYSSLRTLKSRIKGKQMEIS